MTGSTTPIGTQYEDRFWASPDGLQLHYRDYAGRADRPPLLCLPGLTRNARDFEPIADAFAGEWRVICPELRGRGESDYAKDWESYNPLTYLADIEALLAEAEIERFVAVGTSLGGILTMLLAAKDSSRIAGAVLNDIGPVIEPAGLERIRSYVGQLRSFPTWMHAARALEENQSDIYPDYTISEWLRLAKRMMDYTGNGRIAFDYDLKIAEPFRQPGGEVGSPNMWPAFEALAGRPVLAIRGALSDILSDATLKIMAARLPAMQSLTIARTGHAPTLDEPEALDAIARLLAQTA
ncbi:alpha/beta hydrolase [Croceicoccus estronivorus]|uniref:alpha/beta fold hydrolase n=1 Tax=Croceicoccus estronivorus TaxID=1172626 RepID=UPI0008376FC0|nr:alpha/beta hydrolase [Croceicoccus estronivorus]OCC24955.1 alpha/beta hydrolase [Croceicoccus estronivorus]